jgi:hypothetical protein
MKFWEKDAELSHSELMNLAKYKILHLSSEELRQFVEDLIPQAEAAKREGFSGPRPWRI